MADTRVAAAVLFAQNTFGGPTRSVINPLTNSVGTTSTQLLQNNPDRVFWIMFNRSPNKMDIDFTADVATDARIPIAPGGGFISMDVRDDGEGVINPVFAIASAAGSTVYVMEIKRV